MWSNFTEQDIRTRIAERELVEYEQTAGLDRDGNQLPEKIQSIAEQVRNQIIGAIRANPAQPKLGPAGTIPDFMIGHAAVIARVALLGLNPVVEGATDPRRDEYNDARKWVEKLSTMPASAFQDPLPEAGLIFGGQPFDYY